MKCKKETDYRRVDPKAVYELKKVALRLRRKGKEVSEICEITGFADKTVHMTQEESMQSSPKNEGAKQGKSGR